MDTMPKSQARAKARRYSRQYATFWYVREVSPGQFAPWAHHSDDERTVGTFYCGEERKMFEIIDNKIIFDAFVVTCNPCCASAEYMHEMAEALKNCQDGPDAFKKLWYMNNDGTWQVTPN